jgi:hypothetical protein
MFAQASTQQINGHRHVLVFMGIHPDYNTSRLEATAVDHDRHLASTWLALNSQVSGQDCDGATAKLLLGHCSPSRFRLSHLDTGPTDHFEGTKPVSLRVRPEPRWPGTLSQSV